MTRPKNSKNKVSVTVKNVLIESLIELGSSEAIVAWVRGEHLKGKTKKETQNLRMHHYSKTMGEFLKVIARMLPREISISEEKDVAPNQFEGFSDEELQEIIYGKNINTKNGKITIKKKSRV